MIPPEVPWHEWFRVAAYVLLASVAGGLGHIVRRMDKDKPVRWRYVLVQAASAGLAGLFTYWICDALGVGHQWTGISVGICGWMGASASIEVLQKLVWDKLGIDKESNSANHDDIK